ncbi:MAG TPA: hypothetical protein VM686_22875 [Polyangiaceae bacterium]|nr:hypothetical protein [Polyangiaceae bacterium]
MNRSLERAFSIAALACGTWCAVACGGSFHGNDDDVGGSGGTAGSAGRGGQAGSGGSGVAGSSAKGGTTSGGTSSGGTGSGGTCEWNGQIYEAGDTFPAGDGCNSCSCGPDGSVGCTLAICDQCSESQAAYSAAFDEAKACDPMQPDPCSESVSVGLVCGCYSFFNPEHADAIARLVAAQQDYSALSCAGDVQCEPCLPPTSAHCSAEGVCVDVFDDNPGGASCVVEGQVYPSGSSNVPDPFSCNTCQCVDGQLSCTEINCPEACPPDTAPSTQCAECGPIDNCLSVETGCLPSCTDICEFGACIDGVCRMVCG